MTRPSCVHSVHCHVLAILWAVCGESVSPRARLWWLLCPPAALACSGSGVCVPRGVSGGGTAQLSSWHCPAQLVALLCRGFSPKDTVWPLVQAWSLRSRSLCVPGDCPALSLCPCHAGDTLSTLGQCLGSLGALGAVLRCLLSLFQPGVMPWPLPAPAGPGLGCPARNPRSP